MSTTRESLEIHEPPPGSARAPLSLPVALESQWSPCVDIFETRDRYVLLVDLPGISIEHLELRIENDRLHLRGERVAESAARREAYHCTERPTGKFSRSFALPPSVMQSAVRAEMRNGVLEIVLPKQTESRSRPIKIESR